MPSMINEGKAFELGEWNKGLNAGCLPMGGIGSLYSNPSLEYRQPPEREAKLW
ncbi:MAG: hypothetical protein QXY18_05585 [Nitrososphaerota archaeon]